MIAALLLVLLAPARVVGAPASHTEVHYVMGTLFRITADGPAAREAMTGCFADARRLERIFTRFDAASELSQVNAGAGAPVRVSADFGRLLRLAERLRADTDGAFDVTVGPLTALWRREVAPSAADLASARALVARADLQNDVLALPPGGRLDFDGIAKGDAVDACVGHLRAAGVRSALVSLGESSLYALGAPAGARHWDLVVRGTHAGEAAGVLRLRDQAASVSASFGEGDAEGRRPGRIVDPHTGRAVAADALAIAVARSAAAAEAYSKAVLLWGARGGSRAERAGALAAVYVAGGHVQAGPEARRLHVFAAATPGRPS